MPGAIPYAMPVISPITTLQRSMGQSYPHKRPLSTWTSWSLILLSHS